MVRNVRFLGFGRDSRGLFFNVRFLDRTTNPDQRNDVTREQLLGILRSGLAALEVDEHERARTDRSKQQRKAS